MSFVNIVVGKKPRVSQNYKSSSDTVIPDSPENNAAPTICCAFAESKTFIKVM